LAGILVELQKKIFGYLRLIDANSLGQGQIEEIGRFLKEKFNVEMENDFDELSLKNRLDVLKEALDRPIRVCGMVKNEGEPGGGPFWVRNESGTISLQIVESSQVDLNNDSQVRIMAASTHFNPVDLVCGIKDYKGGKFDLTQFVDQNSGFIVERNSGGKRIRTYELPGLWNGAMANWLTVFVQVPLITFNPVTTVNDLLKAAYQPQ